MARYIEHFPSFEGTREQKVLLVSCTHKTFVRTYTYTASIHLCLLKSVSTLTYHSQKLFEAFDEGDEDKFVASVSTYK